jgi:Phosphotransferase enzyme family
MIMVEASSPSQEELHEEAEAHLRWLVEESGEFPDLPTLDELQPDQVASLGGGVDAATYLIKRPDGDVVVKLNSEGLEAEARALGAWQPYTERVPEVLGLGTVPSSGDPPIKYLILAALKNDDGDVVETADAFLERSQESARELGRAVGAELHRLHQAVDGTGFGNFGDSPGKRAYVRQLERLPRRLLCELCRLRPGTRHRR